MPFKAADPRILLSDQAMFDVGYFPPNTLSDWNFPRVQSAR